MADGDAGRARRFAHPHSLFRSLSFLGLGGHALILMATALVQIWPLVLINVFSVLLYGAAITLNNRRWYVAVLAIGLIEVFVHATVATALLGWGSGFHIYLLALVPLVFFFDPWSIRVRVLVSLVVAGAYVALAWASYRFIPDDGRWFIEWFRYGNLLVGAIVLSALSYYYGTAVRRAQVDLERTNAELDALSRTDPLTGLANRREAMAFMEWEHVRCGRSRETFSVALMDVDHFKLVNDRYGHTLGDEALKHVARIVEASLRAQDRVARWGGEEFLLILPQTSQAGASVAAEKVRMAIAGSSLTADGVDISVTVTIGVAVARPDDVVDDVIRRADHALYRGKAGGRNTVVTADE